MIDIVIYETRQATCLSNQIDIRNKLNKVPLLSMKICVLNQPKWPIHVLAVQIPAVGAELARTVRITLKIFAETIIHIIELWEALSNRVFR